MMCRSRYLTADGRVLRCHSQWVHRSDEEQSGDHGHFATVEEMSRITSWDDGDLLAWEAPDCQKCGGSGWESCVVDSDGVFVEGRDGCPACDGTGVDDTIPLTLVGVGSLLRSLSGEDTGTFVIARFCTPYVGTRDGFNYYPDSGGKCWAPLSSLGDSFEVVRAVPPAHTGDTP